MTTEKLTGDMITYGKTFVKTIELRSAVYGKPENEYKIAIDIKPIDRKSMKAIFQKYGIKDESNMDISKADDMMDEVCRLGIVDPNVVSKLTDMLEFLPTKIGAEILALSTGSGEDLENFSKAKKA